MANQSATSDWWETQRSNYDVFVSELVISEASKGHPEAAQRRLAVIADLPLLQISPEVRSLAQALIQNHALPPKAEADAYRGGAERNRSSRRKARERLQAIRPITARAS